MSLNIPSGMLSSALGAKSPDVSGLSAGTSDASFGDLFQEAQQNLANPTGFGLGTSSRASDSSDDSLSRLSNDAFNSVKMQIQMKLQALMEKQKMEKPEVAPEALSKTEQLVQLSEYLGKILADETRVADHEKAGDILDKVLVKLQERAAAGDLAADSFLVDLV
jgi:hypothetical protein